MDRSRWADIGDLVIEKTTKRVEELKWVGVVYKIIRNKYNHATVFINWTPNNPPHYYKERGYSATNIHNLRSRFCVVKT